MLDPVCQPQPAVVQPQTDDGSYVGMNIFGMVIAVACLSMLALMVIAAASPTPPYLRNRANINNVPAVALPTAVSPASPSNPRNKQGPERNGDFTPAF